MSLSSIINIANHINKYNVVQGNTNTQYQTNVTFPTSFTGLPTAFNGQDVFDTHITKSYSGGSGSTAYANGNYNLICSSYGRYRTADPLNSCNLLFDDSDETFWGNNRYNSGPNGIDNYRDGVFHAMPSGEAYDDTTGNYIGSNGTDYYFSTTYDTSQSIDGEWVQVQLPYKIRLTSISTQERSTPQERTMKACYILGSDDGTTWNYIDDVAFPGTQDSTLFTEAVTTTKRYSIIRIVIASAGYIMFNTINFRLTGDTWSLDSTTE